MADQLIECDSDAVGDSISEISALNTDIRENELTSRKIFLISNGTPNTSRVEAFPPVVSLSVGGYRFVTRISTLTKYPDSMLAAMFSGRHKMDKDQQGNYFIDTNGVHFSHKLDFLRHGTLPPNDISGSVYKEACYFNIIPLVEALETTPLIARKLVHDAHRSQFPDYNSVKKKIIKIAMERATIDKTGEVLVYAFRKPFTPRAPYFNINHECISDSAHLTIGPWESAADEESLIRCLEYDLLSEGFSVKPHEAKRRCKYYNGQNCQKTVYKITLNF